MMRVDSQISLIIALAPRTISSVATAPVITLGFDLSPLARAEGWLFQVGKTLCSASFEGGARGELLPSCRLIWQIHSKNEPAHLARCGSPGRLFR